MCIRKQRHLPTTGRMVVVVMTGGDVVLSGDGMKVGTTSQVRAMTSERMVMSRLKSSTYSP